MKDNMFIFKSTQLRANPNVPYTDSNGIRYFKIPSYLLQEINEPAPPQDYTEESYYKTELRESPYVIYTKKNDNEILTLRKRKLHAIRDNLILTGGVEVNGKWYHSDTHSKLQQLALLLAGANMPQGLQWKTMDGSFVTMTPQLAQDIYIAQMQQEQIIFVISEQKLLDNSDVNIGWPPTYQET
jgi:hypothetical protein